MNDLTVSALKGGAVAAFFTLLGITPQALIWSFIGAVALVGFTPSESYRRAILTIVLSGIVGAALGEGLAAYLGGKTTIVVCSLIMGACAKPALSGLAELINIRIEQLKKGPPKS